VVCIEFRDYCASVAEALEDAGAVEAIRGHDQIVLKPNLIQAAPPPVTTSTECIAAVIEYLRARSDARILIAEGSGGGDTLDVFETLGYNDIGDFYDVDLIDLDRVETMKVANPALTLLREFHIPRLLLDAFIISIPVLKAHSMSDVTLSLKNMLGIAPASRYGGSAFRKSRLHGANNGELHRNIVELNTYRSPDFSLIDATVGMAEAHLWGRHCDPPVSRLVAGRDPVAVDAIGAGLLGRDWRTVGHIAQADGVLGHAE